MFRFIRFLIRPKVILKILQALQLINKRKKLFKQLTQSPMASKLAELLINTLAVPLQEILSDKFADTLRKIQPAETRRDILIVLYVPIDSQLEKITDATKTKLDDAGVHALKSAIEIVAAEDGVTLPNVDND